MENQSTTDFGAIKTGQVLGIATLLAAFALGRWEGVALVATFFLITALAFWAGPFVLVYRLLLRPLGIVKPDVRPESLRAHRFAQGVGAISAALAAYLVYAGYTYAGWAMVWVLIVLTVISYKGWCIGCALYYRVQSPTLRRLLVPSAAKQHRGPDKRE